jgi:hypothetical protein
VNKRVCKGMKGKELKAIAWGSEACK